MLSVKLLHMKLSLLASFNFIYKSNYMFHAYNLFL